MKELSKFYGDWNGDAEICQNPLFRAPLFFGIFEIFRGGEVTTGHKIGKFYLLDILYTH
uniref:Uncharacterized protein n=1 Tax=Picea sitchensis TaxID=3332 RepID=D5AC94_PICSI|nr:unknown [Picea sitchensis]